MSSGTSTEPAAFQPWHFFVVVTMLAATAAVLVSRETSAENLVFLSATVMAGGLAAMALYWTLAPFARDEQGSRTPLVGGRTRLALEREKNLVLRSIKELEFDRAMGKIADADFHEMVARLRTRAIGLMKQLDVHEPEWRAEIERELERRLKARGSDAGTARKSAPGSSRAVATATLFCTQCGTPNDVDARFCKACGKKLSA